MRTKIAIILATVALLAFIGMAWGSYWIYSNTVNENVSSYNLILSSDNLSPHQYDNVTFIATLDLNGNPAGSGNTIQFYQGTSVLGSNVTDSNGNAIWTCNMTNTGSLDFHAGYFVS